ncbi:MAG TPA: DUF2157 domain-containing protein [Albitalea sp.]|uniref:DUF2157 domain-containing protein n=1 Tax=Piscinibacter sp. TaxID=1903157 RepID=UPI002ED60008
MDLRLALYELADRHGLHADASRRLHRLAGLEDEPDAAAQWLPRGVAILAAALIGLGLVFWIAANWESLGRAGRFGLLQGVLLAMCVAAMARPAARAPLGLIAFLAIGALFAFFGQTYQTGADPWQLFALWTLLGLPLVLAVRSDVLWAPWTVVALSAVSLWVHAHTGHRWRVEPDDLRAHVMGWLAALALVAALLPMARRFTGAGIWSLRTGLTLWVVMVTSTALGGLFQQHVGAHYGLGVLLLAGAALTLASPRFAEIYGLSAVALGLNTLLVAGLARWLAEGHRGDWIGVLFLLGLVAAGLLAATVSGILRIARRAVQ